MFDLEQEIKNWRSKLAGQEAFQAAHLDELEDHLRSTSAQLSESGLSSEEAFLVAARRLGTDEQLNREYGKTHASNIWANRLLWMLLGLLVLGWTRSIASVAGPLAEIGMASLIGPGLTAGIAYWLGYYLVWGGFLVAICRLTISTNVTWAGRFEQIVNWAGNRPLAACLLLLAATVGVRVAQGLLYLLAIRLNTVEQIATWRMFGHYSNQLINLLLIAGAAYWVFRRLGHRPQTAD